MECEDMFKMLMMGFGFFVLVCLYKIFGRLKRLENAEMEFLRLIYSMPEFNKDEETHI